MSETISIAGIKIYNSSLSSLLSDIETCLTTKDLPAQAGQRPTTILTINPEIVVQAHDDPKLMEILNRSWRTIPDGVGILWAAKFHHQSITERITGVRLTQELLEIAAHEQLTIGVIGGTEQASLQYKKYLNTLFPNDLSSAKGRSASGGNVYSLPGPWIDSTSYESIQNDIREWIESSDGQEFLDKLRKTSILFVAMGAPKQEYFINFLSQRLKTSAKGRSASGGNALIAVAVGGTFDELAGLVPKSPEWMSRVGLKWLFRLATEPWRLKRQTRLLRFIRLVTKES